LIAITYHLTRIGLLIAKIGHKKTVKYYILGVFDPPRLAPYHPLLHWVLQVQVHRSGLTTLYLTICQSRTETLCVRSNFSLTDSWTLDWHLIFNAVAEQDEKLLALEKTGQLTRLPGGQTIREQPPCFPMTITLYTWGGGELVLRLLKTNYTPINQEREKRQQKLEKFFYDNQPQARDETKYMGGLCNNRPNKQFFDTDVMGSQTRNKHRKHRQRKWQWWGMISST
jgi:hypothetical protein